MLKKNELKTLRKFSSRLQGHPDKKKLNILDFGTGALGQGLSVSIGYSLSSKLLKKKNFIFCVLGDGELQEGQIWEAAMYIGSKQIKNIITFIDGNKFQNEESVNKTIKEVNLKKKWESFGFKYIETNGHSVEKLDKIIKEPKLATNGRNPSKDNPTAIPTAFASAIPISKDLSGKLLKK